MKWFLPVFVAASLSCVASDSLLKPINDSGYGTWALRAQAFSMYRDYDGTGNGYSSTLGWNLDYLSPEWQGLSSGFSYIHVDVLHTGGGKYSMDGEGLLYNGYVNVLNEAWLKYKFTATGLSNTFIKAGRQVINSEVFRADEFRQKPRAFEAVLLTTKDLLPHTTLTAGHIDRISNVWDSDSNATLSWKYKDIEDVLGSSQETRGITWGEAVFNGITNLEIAVYDAYACDIVNVSGGRIKYRLFDSTAVNGYYRHESDVGRGMRHSTDMFGASIQQKIDGVTLEPGFLSINGGGLLFEELGTGINHPLGSSMMIYGSMFSAGADTYYLKATAKVGKTALYALYSYTTHNVPVAGATYDGQELNAVVKQPITDRLSVALKVGAGYRDRRDGGTDTVATDSRLFVTFDF